MNFMGTPNVVLQSTGAGSGAHLQRSGEVKTVLDVPCLVSNMKIKRARLDRFSGMHSFSCGLCSGGERNALYVGSPAAGGLARDHARRQGRTQRAAGFSCRGGRSIQRNCGEGRLFGTLFRHSRSGYSHDAPVTTISAPLKVGCRHGLLYENLDVARRGGRGAEVQDRPSATVSTGLCGG